MAKLSIRKKWHLAAAGLLALLLAGCQAGGQSDTPLLPTAPIEVQFFTEPDSGIQAGSPVTLVAEVTQEGQVVEDADRVRFEIWHEDEASGGEHQEEHSAQHSDGSHYEQHSMEGYETENQMLEAVHRGNGQYVLEYTFEKAGTYYVTYHVDARGFHAMTRHEVEVASP